MIHRINTKWEARSVEFLDRDIFIANKYTPYHPEKWAPESTKSNFSFPFFPHQCSIFIDFVVQNTFSLCWIHVNDQAVPHLIWKLFHNCKLFPILPII